MKIETNKDFQSMTAIYVVLHNLNVTFYKPTKK